MPHMEFESMTRIGMRAVACACVLLVSAAAFAQMSPVQGPGGVPFRGLTRTTLPDGSIIGVPPGWRITSANNGSFDMNGPLGEGISLGAALAVYSMPPGPYVLGYRPPVARCCDPVRAQIELAPQFTRMMQRLGKPASQLVRIVEYEPTPWPRGQAAYILSELNLRGRRLLSFGLVAAVPTGGIQWMYYTSAVTAPAEVFRSELPLMLEVWNSWSVSSETQRKRLESAVRTMKNTWENYNAGMAEQRRAHTSANEGWDQVVRGVVTIENIRTGERRQVENTEAQAWVDTGEWRIVPPSELVRKR